MNITIPLNLAKSLASMSAFIPKGVHKLDRVYVNVLPNSIHAVASDRYAIIESLYTERNGEGSLEFQLTADMAKFINSLGAKGSKVPVEFMLIGATLGISALGQSATFTNSQIDNGTELFNKLVEHADSVATGDIAKPITLDVALLSRAAKLVDYEGKKVERWSFSLGQPDSDGRKPAPIEAHSAGVITWHLVQQPLLPA